MDEPAPEGIRLNKFLASCGLGSRRSCETLIAHGRVEINGEICTDLATRVLPEDSVKVDGRSLKQAEVATLLLNKPTGYLCSRGDTHDRPTVYDLIPRRFHHLGHVGRLDMDSEGLLLLTNDGDVAQALTHPRHKIEKEYLVQLDRAFPEALAPRLIQGVEIPEGLAHADELQFLARKQLRIILTQGYKRQIRQMFEVFGFEVRKLERIRIGQLTAPAMSTGDWRMLGRKDVELALTNPDRSRRKRV